MNITNRIRDLVEEHIVDDHHGDIVRFIDELLLLTLDAGEIHCAIAREQGLLFRTPNEPPFEVKLGRARSKLRMMCAHLAVLCMENGSENILLGGEGVIKKSFPEMSPVALAAKQGCAEHNASPLVNGSGSESAVGLATVAAGRPEQWQVRHQNTPSQHEFTIRAL